MKEAIKPEFPKIIKSVISPENLTEQVKANYLNSSPFHISLLSLGDNDNYLVQTQDEKYVLRLYRHNKHWLPTKESYAFEFQLLNYLHHNKLLVSYPIAGNNEEYLGTISAPEGIRYWSLFSFASGKLMQFNCENCYNYGKVISQFHLLTISPLLCHI